jgi:Mg-chelatase subunit ChlD
MAGPQTAIGEAIGLAIKHFESSKSEHRVVVLLTDGNDTGSKVPPKKAAEIASQRGITVHSVRRLGQNLIISNSIDHRDSPLPAGTSAYE